MLEGRGQLAGGEPRPVGVETVVLDVSPTQETFVPFEISTIEMPSGWYCLECDVAVVPPKARTIVSVPAAFAVTRTSSSLAVPKSSATM